ncbi:MAG: hypothetical protein FWC99_07320, partial [Coriobacteriia bacterium]|nr:hypothetical protein [Coriobacteriia bacterium]
NTLIGGKEVGAAVSLGVDSFYTLKSNLDAEQESFRPTQLLYTSSRGIPEENQLKHEAEGRQKEAKNAAQVMELPLVFIYSNSRTVFPFVSHVYGHPFTNMASVFALRKLFRMYYYSTAYDISQFSLLGTSKRPADNYLLLLIYVFTMPDLTFHISGANVTREEKLELIADCEVVQRYLRVCLAGTKNCGKGCGKSRKCQRTLLELDYLGKLDGFYESFDIGYYKENRAWYFKELIRDGESAFLKPIHDHFLVNEPELMKEAQRLVEIDEAEEREKERVRVEKQERKRIRTLIKHDMQGELDELQDSVDFDVDEYLKNRIEYFKIVIRKKNSKFYSKAYEHFIVKEATLMKEAQKSLSRGRIGRRLKRFVQK